MLYFEKYKMPAANLGEENPFPDIHNIEYIHASFQVSKNVTDEEQKYMGKGKISTLLPYKIQDGYDRNRTVKEFDAAVLENDYLRAVFLPQLGGRLWSLFDKTENRELLYVNSVFQPANLALRNAWYSGGVEFNLGIKGHNPLTCSPMFAERVEYKNGAVALNMFEYERIRGVAYSISAYLPEDSRVLYIRPRIENTSSDTKWMYWWSNIAVPEENETRVLVPADKAFLTHYYDGHYQLDKVNTPVYQGTDTSYPMRLKNAQDFFYQIEDEKPKWIAAVDGSGKGMWQASQKILKGRKLFLWGHSQGGRNWNKFLSNEGESYVEIQAGLAYTQLEHIPMPGNTVWQWVEAYGSLNCDNSTIHSNDWSAAQSEAARRIDSVLPLDSAEEFLSEIFPKDEEIAARETIYVGSGWGALENRVREHCGQSPISHFVSFPEDSFGEEQEEWLKLLEHGTLGEHDENDPPASFITGSFWIDALEASVAAKDKSNWYAYLQLGVLHYADKNIDGALKAWLKSVELKETVWGLRNLAALYKSELQDISAAVDYILKAIKIRNNIWQLMSECAAILIAAKKDDVWLEIFEQMPEDLKQVGRLRLLKAIAHINLKQFKKAAEIVCDEFSMPDIREGELSISEIWLKLYTTIAAEEAGITDRDEAEKLARERYPLPKHLDFRMTV